MKLMLKNNPTVLGMPMSLKNVKNKISKIDK